MDRLKFYFWIYVLVPILIFSFRPIQSGDFFIWVAIGRDSLLSKQILRIDPYTVSQTLEMVYPAISFLYGALYLLLGLDWVALLHKLIPGLWCLIWWRYGGLRKRVQKENWNSGLHLVTSVSLLGLTLIMVERPALVASPLLLIAFIWVRRAAREGRLSNKSILEMIALEILWTQVHGSFPLLPIMMLWQSCLFFFRSQHRLWLRWLMASGFVGLFAVLNPFGWKIFPYILQTAELSKKRGLDEWTPIWQFHYPFASCIFLLTSFALLVFLRHKLKTRNNFLAIAFDPFTLLWVSGLFTVRNSFFVFLALPVFFISWDESMDYHPNSVATDDLKSSLSKQFNSFLVALVVLLIVVLSPPIRERFSSSYPEVLLPVFDPRNHLPKALAYLKAHPGLIFNEWDLGSDLSLGQPNQYLIDTRNVIFSDFVHDAHLEFLKNPAASNALLQQHQFRFFLIDAKKHPQVIHWLELNQGKKILSEGNVDLYERIL